MTVAIVDCGGANLRSVQRAIELRNMKTTITNKKSDILKASYVILPGVGSADSVMSSLKSNDLVETIKNLSQPVLGICIGMHILFESSEENHTSCMGIISGKIKKFKFKDSFKVLKMEWNQVSDDTRAKANYGLPFSAVVRKNNFIGCQFHPEKSSTAGTKFLDYFFKSI